MDFYDAGFDPEKAVDQVVNWIRDFFEENGKGCNAVVGLSGGKDSSVTAAVLVKALGKDRVIGVTIPNGGPVEDRILEHLVEILGIRTYEIDIKEAFDSIIGEVRGCLGEEPSEQTVINLPPRLRMSSLYAISQSLNGRVVNTGNLSEDWVGYSTRYGDSAGDFAPLARFTVQEVKAMGKALGLPDDIVERVPDDGLSGKSDEEKLGFTYDTLDRYIRTGEIDSPEDKEKIDRLHRLNLFKTQLMPAFEHDGPVKA